MFPPMTLGWLRPLTTFTAVNDDVLWLCSRLDLPLLGMRPTSTEQTRRLSPEVGHLLLVTIHHAEAIFILNNSKSALLCSFLLLASILSYLGLLLQVVMDVCEITL